jgi:2-dehydro-3-deoxyphosphooctonate aldolase (KDO 8-P synthase)
MTIVTVGHGLRNIGLSNRSPLTVIAGPCALESCDMALEVATELANIQDQLCLNVIFKASFDKANRTSGAAPRGVGLDAALSIFHEIKTRTSLLITTDVHETAQCARVAKHVDLLQIPALLSRQTDLIIAAAQTGLPVNIKKGPFMAPQDMQHAIEKARHHSARGVIVTERGACFGYNNLVADMRSLEVLKETNAPVIFDPCHAAQYPSGQGQASSGDRRFIAPLARAAVAIGIAGIFIETHPDPDKAISDGATQIPLKGLAQLVKELSAFDKIAKKLESHDEGL